MIDLLRFKKALIYQYENCIAYRKICTAAHFSLDAPLEDLSSVPFIVNSLFKRSLMLFPELICVPKERIYVWTFSSSTNGDPSIIGRTLRDIRLRNRGYVQMRKQVIKRADISLLFLPPPRFLRKHRSILFNRPLEPFLASLISSRAFYLSNKENTFLLLNPNNKAVTFDKEQAIRQLERAESTGSTIILGGSVIFTYLFLGWLKKKKIRFQLGNKGFISTGAGGWDGKKGNFNLGEEIDKEEYVELAHQVLGIPIDHILDGYGTTEFPFMFYGRYSPEFKDFLYHTPPHAHVIIRRKDDLRPADIGERGFIELLTSEVDGYPGAAILTDDTALLVSDGKDPIFTNIRRASTSFKAGCAAFI